jgi:hypothetical protein
MQIFHIFFEICKYLTEKMPLHGLFLAVTPRPVASRKADFGVAGHQRFGGVPRKSWWSVTKSLVECHQLTDAPAPPGGGQKARLTGIFSENDGVMAQNWQKVFAGMEIMLYICRKKKP